MSLTRKEFLSSVVGVAAGAAGAALLVACSDSGSSADAAVTGNCTMNGTTTAIVGNHGHVLMGSKADVTAAAAKTYNIMGTADHTHNVTISAALFAMLTNTTTVTTISTGAAGDGHTHSITVMCA